MRIHLKPPKRSVQDVLSRLNARLAEPELRALFMGAQASTNLRMGPQHLFDEIVGPGRDFGESLEDANENLQTLMWLWNTLVQDHEQHRVCLTPRALASPTTVDCLCALLALRASEVSWFVRGIDAGGDDPMEFGAEGERLLNGIAKASAFLQRFQELISRTPAPPAHELQATLESIEDLTSTLEALIDDLMSVGDGVRKQALAEYGALRGQATDDGVAPARSPRTGRNDPCPCGSGKKWKRCCGGAAPAQH
ncbi:MAG: SEC-C metal-binding domain-containing protein [Anaeromyxobacter sp.]